MAKRSIRSKIQIMAEIIDLCRQPKTKTRLLHRTNLTWSAATEYLSFLQSRGLLEIHHSRTKYAATQKGLQFVEKWRKITQLLSQN